MKYFRNVTPKISSPETLMKMERAIVSARYLARSWLIWAYNKNSLDMKNYKFVTKSVLS